MNVTVELFSLNRTMAENLLKNCAYPWQALSELNKFIIDAGAKLDGEEFSEVSPAVWVHKNACVSPSAYLAPPCIICAGTQVRHGAFIRGGALIGENCVVGNSTELKNVILSDGVQVPHFNYAGDSIFGYKAHAGAGAITSNVRADKSSVNVVYGGNIYRTGLKKLGAMIGDFAEIGCNSVLCPGVVVGRNSVVYPLSLVRGSVPADSIFKSDGSVVAKK